MVSENDLVVGNTYFMVTYPDSAMSVPIVITYTNLGKDPDDIEQDEPGTRYYFRYLPAFQSEADEDDAEDASAYNWTDVFPNLFSGCGERVPTSFGEEKLQGFNTVDGLIDELIRVRERLVRREMS